MNTFCHMKDSWCFTFSQNSVTKVAFLPLSENEISSETEILHGVDDLFYPQQLRHQQKCCFSRGLLGRAVGVSYACRLFSMCDTDNWATSSRRRGQIESICMISATWLDRKTQPSDEVRKRATGARMHVRNVFSILYRIHALPSPGMQLPGP